MVSDCLCCFLVFSCCSPALFLLFPCLPFNCASPVQCVQTNALHAHIRRLCCVLRGGRGRLAAARSRQAAFHGCRAASPAGGLGACLASLLSALCSLLSPLTSNPPSLVSSLSSLRTPLVSLFSFLQAIFKTPGVMAMITGVFHCLPLAIHWRFPTHSLAFPGLSMTSTTFH